jgi:hypothetical protein
MILANTRGQLKPNDLQLVLLLLSRGSAARRALLERRLTQEGPDSLLESPDLPEALLAVRTILVPSPALFFYVMVRHALRTAEVDDRELADYLASMLLEFGRRERAYQVDWNDDQRHRYVIDILADLELSQGARRFKVMVHLGNYALWLAGLFWTTSRRDSFERRPGSRHYDTLGRRVSSWLPTTHSPTTTTSRRFFARGRTLSRSSRCAQRHQRAGLFPSGYLH